MAETWPKTLPPAEVADVPALEAILGQMGFNPHRKQQRSPADYVMVIGALIVCAALLAWAFLG